eukprot:UN00684
MLNSELEEAKQENQKLHKEYEELSEKHSGLMSNINSENGDGGASASSNVKIAAAQSTIKNLELEMNRMEGQLKDQTIRLEKEGGKMINLRIKWNR